jgi:hypothetical protein
MARTRFTSIGVVIDFDHSEITQISSHLNTGAATTSTLTAVLAAAGVTASASIITAIISGLLWFGSAALNGCNSHQRGTSLTVMWVGLPWCKSR